MSKDYQQTTVLKAGAESLGQMGQMGGGMGNMRSQFQNLQKQMKVLL